MSFWSQLSSQTNPHSRPLLKVGVETRIESFDERVHDREPSIRDDENVINESESSADPNQFEAKYQEEKSHLSCGKALDGADEALESDDKPTPRPITMKKQPVVEKVSETMEDVYKYEHENEQQEWNSQNGCICSSECNNGSSTSKSHGVEEKEWSSRNSEKSLVKVHIDNKEMVQVVREGDQGTHAELNETEVNHKNTANQPTLNQQILQSNTTGIKSETNRPALLGTPNRPIRPSKFVFLSDEKSVPSDLERLRTTTMRRRRDLSAKMHDLDCQVASLMSKYGEEKMDLDLAIRDTIDRSICHPLEESVERLAMERESSAYRGPAIRDVERKLSELENHMARHIHVIVNDAKRTELDRLHNNLYQEVIPGIRIEDSKSDKIEGGVIRRFEHVAGKITHEFHAESSARRSALEQVKIDLDEANDRDERRGDDLLNTIRELRKKVQRERLERRAADQKILDEIINTTASMKRALLLAVAGTA